MCGISGKLFFDKERAVSQEELVKMSSSITHRGPDDSGVFIDQNVGLGFRRLSIIDLKLGHQPLSDDSKRFWITFNGEIYNYQEIKSRLIARGYVFNTNSDTEVIVNLYAEYREKCVDQLRGMFSFVIWDKKEKELFGARDRLGIKPFFYYYDEEKLVWGSEIKSILATNDIDKNINLKSLDYYFAYGYSPNKTSIYDNIQKLRPGCYFKYSLRERKKITFKKYWTIEFNPITGRSEEYWKEKLFNTLNESVKMRMISDVPLGAFLSGGIDSSIIVALMSMNSSKAINTFSIGFKEEKYNELKYARLVAEKYQTNHHEFIVEPESIDLLPKLVKAYDEPFADASAIPTYYVSKLTRETVTVALSGDGGDELFAGYNSYSKLKKIHDRRVGMKAFFSFLNKSLPDHVFGKGLSYYLSKNRDELSAYYCFWKDYERRKIFNSDIRESIQLGSEIQKINALSLMKGDFLSKMQQLDMETYMVDGILTKVDRASMMNSLEVRVPILDHKFAELSYQIPSSLKMKGENKKYILKETFKHILPTGILEHKKQGFAVPLETWFKGDLRDYSYDVLLGSNNLYNYLNRNQIMDILDNHQKGVRDYSEKIWSLLFLNEWLIQNS